MTRTEALEVYKTEQSKFDSTRKIQWQFNIASWTLIVAAIYFFDHRNLPVDTTALWLLSGIFFLSHLFFVYLTQNSLEASKKIWGDVFKLLNTEEVIITVELPKKSQIKFRDFKWVVFQVFVTLVLLSVLIILNLSK